MENKWFLNLLKNKIAKKAILANVTLVFFIWFVNEKWSNCVKMSLNPFDNKLLKLNHIFAIKIKMMK